MTEHLEEIGVGPWRGEWPTDERYDPELLAHGDRRNVGDQYRYWTREAIVADLDTRRFAYHVAIEKSRNGDPGNRRPGTTTRLMGHPDWFSLQSRRVPAPSR
ncbi:hypothetical protein Pen01_16810 [Phytomonospora endophytica]|nr:hypothetical protein Pen01_16810 [Phytomonospora endophytica]